LNQLPVLFLPGTLCTGDIFNHQVEALSRLASRVEVVGFSTEVHVDDMARRVAERIYPDTRAAIVGFSMGGMAAMALARLEPSLIDRLALLNSNSHAELKDRQTLRLEHLKLAQQHGLGPVIQEHYLPRYLHRQESQHRQLILDMADRLGVASFSAQIEALASRPDSRRTLLALHCPTLVLGCCEDELCPPEEQRKMSQWVNGSELRLLEDCGHFSTLEQPAAVSEALCKWYRKDSR
jgi:pimeloyl-ACP methyl ester carboxylesterase